MANRWSWEAWQADGFGKHGQQIVLQTMVLRSMAFKQFWEIRPADDPEKHGRPSCAPLFKHTMHAAIRWPST
eukprot:scaffold306876_cov20-Tisochrysis_lutea.AAC.2